MAGKLQPPEEVYTLHRKLAGAYNLCIKLGSVVSCRDLLDEVSEVTSSLITAVALSQWHNVYPSTPLINADHYVINSWAVMIFKIHFAGYKFGSEDEGADTGNGDDLKAAGDPWVLDYFNFKPKSS
eukprot:scaffold11723_cov25-Cyclotella_meneghiniana.AAC.2